MTEPNPYPILVRKWEGMQALTIACARCHATRVIDAGEIMNEDVYLCPQDEYGKPVACGGTAQMKYVEAEECPNCHELGFYEEANNGCCSRICMLQAEYAATLSVGGDAA